ncbi:thiamine ABC transport system, permease protein [Escherichia coli]|uniref:Thiamine ABC transport system, permease protein n=1 Tax=Escherichia coli TaxID=562 RepID=A0A376LHJ8_ECOLX|nr:thiamine ABC transport system, permease protein [Escherichia coli]
MALMAIPYALKVLENPMRDITARYSMLCQSLGIEGWSRLKVVEPARPETPTGAGRWPLLVCCRLVILAWWHCSVTMISVPCRFISTSKLVPIRSQDGAVTALIPAATLFSAVLP